MSLFKRIFDISWQQMQAKVRYRLLILTLLPILMTLISLVFITIYWNISYTSQQLFMKVKADLAVAENTLQQVQIRQEQQLVHLANSWAFQTAFSQLQQDKNNQQALQTIAEVLTQTQQQFNLDFLRIISVEQVEKNPDLSALLRHKPRNPASGVMVLTSERLKEIDPQLAQYATIDLKPTQRALAPRKQQEHRGLVSRSVLPIINSDSSVNWYLDGGNLFNKDTVIVDHISNLVYDKGTLPAHSIGTVTVFLDNVRVSTNVPMNASSSQYSEKNRALGTLVSEEVKQKVLVDGQTWVDRAFVFNDWYISAYAPLLDIYGKRVGMVYTGFSEAPFINIYLLNIIELGSILMLVLFGSGLLVYRGAYSLLKPIERIHQVVKAVQSGRNVRIGELGLDRDNELAHLAEQFDSMLDLLQRRNLQIQAAAEQLELKVEQRTKSLQDKTEELQRNVELLNETRQQLVTNEKLTALGELTAGIAHEINNPTAVILGNMELLKYELGDQAEQVSEEIDLVIQQVGRISTIIRSLLQYSRPGEFNAPIEMHQMTPIVEEVLVLVRHSIQKQEVVLVKALNASCPVEVNRPQLQQVLINLVVNAAHAIEARNDNGKGKIWIRTQDWLEGDEPIGVKIEVEDEGVGINSEQLSRIFDPFYTTRKDGTGLGLSLSYGIIKRLGGTIEVKSTEGKGTVFIIGLYHRAKDEQTNNPFEGLQFV
ncbi:sensor histidine kinase [Shewanella glacialimarina]